MIASSASRDGNWRRHLFPLAVLAAVILISFIVRIRLLDAPLERDEGEHAYLAQTLLAEYAPWQLAYNMKLPGTDAMYAVAMAIFGQTAVAIRIWLLLINTATILLVALLGRRLFGIAGGAAAGAAYGILSFGQGIFGTIAHSTHYVAFFAVLGTWFLLRAGTGIRGIFISGLIYGLAFQMKQPGLCFAPFGALYVIWNCRKSGLSPAGNLRRLGIFCGGVLLPYVLLCLELWRDGTFGRFWFWTVTLTYAFAAQFPVATRLHHFAVVFPQVVGPNIFIWVLAVLGLLVACWNPLTRRSALFTAVFLLFSSFTVSLAGVFNPSYFIPALPGLALAAGACVASMAGNPRTESDEAVSDFRTAILSRASFLLLTAAFCFAVFEQRAYLFQMTPFEFSRNTYGLNPFPEAIEVGDYIRSHSGPGARIAVLGSEAEIYFYSRRQAATGYLFTYGLMENHKYAARGQSEMMAEIENARPEFLVFVAIPTSWLQKPTSSRAIFRWVRDYTRNYYRVAGVVDMLAEGPAKFVWGATAADYTPMTPAYITIYQRK